MAKQKKSTTGSRVIWKKNKKLEGKKSEGGKVRLGSMVKQGKTRAEKPLKKIQKRSKVM